jgi:hypothetical protein
MADNAKANGSSVLTPNMGFELWGPALAGAAKWNGKMYEGFALLGSEWLDFVNRRLKEDLSLPQRMCACRTPEEARDTYAAFWRQAVDDYQKEFTVMAKLGSGVLSNSLTAAQNRTEEEGRDLWRPFAAAA